MGTVALVLVELVASLLLAHRLSIPENRRFSFKLVLFAWILLFSLLAMVNDWMSFSDGSDDWDYYYSAGTLHSWSDLFDPVAISRHFVQPGYNITLNALNLTFSPSLLGFKSFNFFCFLLLVLVWARSVASLGGVSLSKSFALACLFLTPLWFYFFFLLKDMVIALMWAIFINGALRVYQDSLSWKGWLLQLFAVAAFIPLRVPLVVQAAVVMLLVALARSIAIGTLARKSLTLLASGFAVAGIAWLVRDPTALATFGVTSNTHTLAAPELMTRVKENSEATSLNKMLFPVIYIFSETSALNPVLWRVLDSAWLRGVLAFPWIFLVVPLLPVGAIWLLRRPLQVPQERFRMTATRLLATPWVVVVAFIATSVAVSFLSGDTTRWRIADMPALLAVAIAGWQSMRRRMAFRFVGIWICATGSLFVLHVLFRAS